ncbi:hypothetical protein SCALM49S_04863 [Streptomyces californicus]
MLPGAGGRTRPGLASDRGVDAAPGLRADGRGGRRPPARGRPAGRGHRPLPVRGAPRSNASGAGSWTERRCWTWRPDASPRRARRASAGSGTAARIAIDDLLYLSICLSDGTAADALFDLTPPEQVTGILRDAGLRGITVRHRTEELFDTPVERFDPDQVHLAHALAIDAGTSGRGHRVAQLDTTRANTGSARSFTDLLQALWTPSKVHPEVAGRLRDLLAHNVLRHRLAPDFSSDASRWSSKTGTLLNLRHEIGVVEHAGGESFAIAVLTESSVAAAAQPGADALMAEAARRLRDHLRQGPGPLGRLR